MNLSLTLSTGELIPLIDMYNSTPEARRDKKQLGDCVTKYKIFMELAREALIKLQERNLVMFDALVGDTACQLRALLISQLANHPHLDKTLLTLIKLISTGILQLDKIALPSKGTLAFCHTEGALIVKSKMMTMESLGEIECPLCMTVKQIVLDYYEDGLNVALPEPLHAAILAYALTITKQSADTLVEKDPISGIVQLSRRGNEKLISFSEVRNSPVAARMSAGFGKDLLALAKRNLSRLSVNYLQGEALALPLSSECAELQALSKRVKEKNKMCSAPCYAGLEIILRRAHATETAICLKIIRINSSNALEIDSILLLYEPIREKDLQFHIITAAERVNLKAAVIVIEAVSIDSHTVDNGEAFRKALLERSIEDIVLANAAIHTQYTSAISDEDLPSTSKQMAYKKLALLEGFCEENPKLCQIYHIFCDTIARQQRR